MELLSFCFLNIDMALMCKVLTGTKSNLAAEYIVETIGKQNLLKFLKAAIRKA